MLQSLRCDSSELLMGLLLVVCCMRALSAQLLTHMPAMLRPSHAVRDHASKASLYSAQVSVERLSKAMEAAEDEMESAFRRTGAHIHLLQHVCGPVEKCCMCNAKPAMFLGCAVPWGVHVGCVAGDRCSLLQC